MSELVFDVETKKEFAEVGGHYNAHLLGVAVVGVYTYKDKRFYAFEERELGKLEELIIQANLVVGFNIKKFDYLVLQPYFKKVILAKLPTLDIMEEVEKKIGFRLGLDTLARNTLGEQKTSHGLEALQWFREGRIEDVKNYCLNDVRLTRDLYEYGRKHGVLLFDSRGNGLKTIPASWFPAEAQDIKSVLAQAFKNKQTVEIDYVSASPEEGENGRNKRNIEIYALRGDTIEAYCYMRQDRRNFKIYRILDARPIENSKPQRPALF